MNFFSRNTLFVIFVLFTVNAAKGSDEDGNIWAVLVTTFSGSYRYAAEAAIYKAYRLLIDGGVSPNNIIVFSPDEAAFSRQNLYPGTVYFGTDSIDSNSENVYIGLENIDYAGWNNSARNFLAVITGNEKAAISGSKRVLKTDPDDKVLIYFIGYTRYDGLTFQDYSQVPIGKFVSLLEDLQEDKFFKKLLLIFDGSSSGLVFDNYLTQKQGIVAITSGGIFDYYKPCFLEKGIADYTAPCFSYNWLKFVEQAQNGDKDENGSTVLDLLDYIKYSQIESTVNIYGNLAAASKTKISSFFGKKNSNGEPEDSKIMIRNPREISNAEFQRNPVSVSTNGVASETDAESDHNLIDEIMSNIYKESIAGTPVPITEILNGDYTLSVEKVSCFMNLISTLRSECSYIEERYLARVHFNKLVNLCALDVIPEKKVINSMSMECAQKKTQ